MSFKITEPINSILKYNYYETHINQYQNTIKTSGYVKIPYTSKTNTPNIIFLDNQYIAKYLYIVEKIQNIEGVDYDATLVIEHSSITNSEPLYVCIPLKTVSNMRSPIDDIIEGNQNIDLTINDFNKSKTAIVYENHFMQNATVVVFTTPIEVGSQFQEMRPGLFIIAPYADNYSTITITSILGNNIVEGFKEGLDTTMAGYCQPISEIDTEINNELQVGIDNNLLKMGQTNTILNTVINFFGFFVLMMFVVFAVPTAYQYLIFDLVMDNTEFNPQEKLNRLNAVDMITSLLIFGFAFAYLNHGIVHNVFGCTVAGFYIFIFFIASMVTLQFARISKPEEFLRKFIQTDKDKDSPSASFDYVKPDFFGLIIDNLSILFLKKVPDPTTGKDIYKFQPGALLWVIIYLIFYFILYANNLQKSDGAFFLLSLPVLFAFIAWYFVILISYYWKKYNEKI